MTKEPQPNRDALAASLLPMVLKFHPELVGFGRKAAEVAYIYADGLLRASRRSS